MRQILNAGGILAAPHVTTTSIFGAPIRPLLQLYKNQNYAEKDDDVEGTQQCAKCDAIPHREVCVRPSLFSFSNQHGNHQIQLDKTIRGKHKQVQKKSSSWEDSNDGTYG